MDPNELSDALVSDVQVTRGLFLLSKLGLYSLLKIIIK